MTLLVDKRAAARAAEAKAAPQPDSLLATTRRGSPRGEYAVLPDIGRVWIQLAGEVVVDEIESAVFAAMAALKIPLTAINSPTYVSRRTALTLAWAVRHPDPDKRDRCAGTEEQWVAEDIDFLNACGLIYNDVRERLNPIASDSLTAAEFEEIRLEHEKKNPTMLRTFGVASLSIYLATTDAPPARSPSPPSSSGPS